MKKEKLLFTEQIARIDLLKNVIFFVTYIVFCGALMYLFLVPAFDRYREARKNYVRDEVILKKTRSENEDLNQVYRAFLADSQSILYMLASKADSEVMTDTFKKYFNYLKVTQTTSTELEGNIVVTNYVFDAKVKSLNRLNDFFLSLNDIGMLLQLSLPIEFASNENYINIRFLIKKYSVNSSITEVEE